MLFFSFSLVILPAPFVIVNTVGIDFTLAIDSPTHFNSGVNNSDDKNVILKAVFELEEIDRVGKMNNSHNDINYSSDWLLLPPPLKYNNRYYTSKPLQLSPFSLLFLFFQLSFAHFNSNQLAPTLLSHSIIYSFLLPLLTPTLPLLF